MSFENLPALLALIPMLLLVHVAGRRPGAAGRLRWIIAVLLPLALARPVLHRGGDGLDLVVLVDRSRSMPAGSDAEADGLLQLIEQEAGPTHRVGIVSFGREARVERAPVKGGRFAGFQRAVDGDATDLAAALDLAEQLLPRDRAGRVLLVSDGQATGGDARAAARRLALRGTPVDFRHLSRRETGQDVAVRELAVPASLATGEPFHLTARVVASSAREVEYVLRRNGALLSRGTTTLREGENRIVFRDRLDEQGLAEYRFELLGVGDEVPENDQGRAVVRAEGRPQVLILRQDGQAGALARTLAKSGLEVKVAAPAIPSLDALEGFAAVVLEDVPAEALGERGMRVLDAWVRLKAGGLLVTGGPSSFGQGGYHRSILDPLLPVSMELRPEQRRGSMAMVIAMDRSGSMSAPTPDGRTKMSLAAEGAVAALQLLAPGDEAGVWVVDQKAHRIVELTPVEEGLPLDRVASISAMGGGIFVFEALEATAFEIDQSTKQTRHIVLFADAADAEQPGNYQELLADLAKKKITVSVIGLGRETDSDAALLTDIARRGNGRVYFTESAMELPRLFAQETIIVARAAFIDEPTAVAPAGELALLGAPDPVLLSPPHLGGYNLTYLRPSAGALYRTLDENHAPALAAWSRGLGRVAAFTGEVDGPRAAILTGWRGYRALFGKTVRWAMGPEESGDAVLKVRREGHDLLVTAEIDPDASERYAGASVTLLRGSAEGTPEEAPLRLESDGKLVARFRLSGSDTYHPVVKLGGEVLRAPPATLPYAPEFEPRAPDAGRRELEAIASLTGGRERLSVEGLFERAALSHSRLPLAPWLTALVLLLVLLEVAARRLIPAQRPAVAAPSPMPGSQPTVPFRDAPAVEATEPAPSAETEAAPSPPLDATASALEMARARRKKAQDR